MSKKKTHEEIIEEYAKKIDKSYRINMSEMCLTIKEIQEERSLVNSRRIKNSEAFGLEYKGDKPLSFEVIDARFRECMRKMDKFPDLSKSK